MLTFFCKTGQSCIESWCDDVVYCALTGAALNACHFEKENCQSILICRSPWETNISLWLIGSKTKQPRWLLSELHIFPSLQVIICTNIYYNYFSQLIFCHYLLKLIEILALFLLLYAEQVRIKRYKPTVY